MIKDVWIRFSSIKWNISSLKTKIVDKMTCMRSCNDANQTVWQKWVLRFSTSKLDKAKWNFFSVMYMLTLILKGKLMLQNNNLALLKIKFDVKKIRFNFWQIEEINPFKIDL